ncbi:MAG TPA: ATP-binding protein, partial [Puia sp.]|nr:ATP-binding protein [Puia sp.]
AKYSHCKKITIVIALDNHEITLQITDDGRGFNAGNGTTGNGLRNMKQRANDMNGNVAITSEKGQGTTVFLKLKPHE